MVPWFYLILFRSLCLYERDGVEVMLVETYSLYGSKKSPLTLILADEVLLSGISV